jgi:hypothetical protein
MYGPVWFIQERFVNRIHYAASNRVWDGNVSQELESM